MSLARGRADRPFWPRPESVVSSGGEGMLEQAACNELLSRLHHVLPHLKRPTLLIEKCESLLPAHRKALLVPQSYRMRKCDFSDHAFSVFLVVIALPPLVYCSSGIPEATLGPCTLDTWNKPTGNNSPSKSPGGEFCFVASYASIRDVRRLPPCLRSVPTRLSMRR
jgi:hypothetical protein